jgi:hypothetical protein
MILGINSLIEATKAELVETAQAFRLREDGMKMNDGFWESWNQLRRRHTCLADVQQFILDREISTESSPFLAPLFALDCLIAENERQMEKLAQEFDHEMLDYQLEDLLDRCSSLERRRKKLMETRKYISDLAFGRPARVQQND